ncbi:Peptidylprolyl isomerase [Bertholletia excelsa]
MSSVYVSEPPTKGKVIVNTTYGPLDIELWPKEAPKAVRNFVQLCLEGYYENTTFHRIIKSFLVQGGDPTGTGTGGESVYGSVFADEFHSRLRFNRRGIVACANAGTPHSNGSQFFITLDRCDWLDKKHSIFGKVTGDSIYNLARLGDIETDKDDRPLDPPPKITSVEVLWNPFDDIVPRVAPTRSLLTSTVDADNKASKKKPVKKLNLLSFGEEAEEEEKELAAVKTKIKSSHDVLNDPRLLKEENPSKELNSSEVKARRDLQLSIREALSLKKEVLAKEPEAESPESLDDSDDDEATFDARMRLQILKKRRQLEDLPTKQKIRNETSSPKDHDRSQQRRKMRTVTCEGFHDPTGRFQNFSLAEENQDHTQHYQTQRKEIEAIPEGFKPILDLGLLLCHGYPLRSTASSSASFQHFQTNGTDASQAVKCLSSEVKSTPDYP